MCRFGIRGADPPHSHLALDPSARRIRPGPGVPGSAPRLSLDIKKDIAGASGAPEKITLNHAACGKHVCLLERPAPRRAIDSAGSIPAGGPGRPRDPNRVLGSTAPTRDPKPQRSPLWDPPPARVGGLCASPRVAPGPARSAPFRAYCPVPGRIRNPRARGSATAPRWDPRMRPNGADPQDRATWC